MTIYQHFRKEEKPFVDNVLEWKENVVNQYRPKLTDFLDPRQQDIMQMLYGDQGDVTLTFHGGYDAAERKRALILPPYTECSMADFSLSLFQLEYPVKFSTITHPQLLGSLMGLGLIREKFGDLLFQDDAIQFVATTEIADYIRIHFNKVGSTQVSCKEMALTDIIQPAEEWLEGSGTISTARLDAVLAEIFRLSRGKAVELIEHNHVKLNWKQVNKPSEAIQAGDYLSLRGHGRSQLLSNEGLTKKGKQRITYKRLK